MFGLVARVGQVNGHFKVAELVPTVCVDAQSVGWHDLREKLDQGRVRF